MNSDLQLQNYLDSMTEAVFLHQEDELETLRQRYSINRADAIKWITFVHELNANLVEVKPAPKFTKRLKAELMGETQARPVVSLGSWPIRVQIAAVIAALVGGLTLFLRFRNQVQNRHALKSPEPVAEEVTL